MVTHLSKVFANIMAPLSLVMASASLPVPVSAQSQPTATSAPINTMDSETATLMQFAISQGQRDFAIVSKSNARLYLIENGHIVFDVPVGLGEDRNLGPIQGMENRKNTPEGRFGVRIANDANALSISGMPVVDFACTRDMRFCMSMHATFLGEFNARQARINTPTAADNFFSNGCINVRPEDMRVVLNFFATHRAGNNEHAHSFLYVSPHDTSRTRELFGIPANFGASNAGNMAVSAP